MTYNTLKIVNTDTGDLVDILNTYLTNQSPFWSRHSRYRSRSRTRSNDQDKHCTWDISRSNSSESDLDLNVLEEVPLQYCLKSNSRSGSGWVRYRSRSPVRRSS